MYTFIHTRGFIENTLIYEYIKKGELCGVSEHLLPMSYPGFQQLSIIRNSDRKDLNGNPPTRGFFKIGGTRINTVVGWVGGFLQNMNNNHLTAINKWEFRCLHFEKSSDLLFRQPGSLDLFRISAFSARQSWHVLSPGW